MNDRSERPTADPEAQARVFDIVADAHIAMLANLGPGGNWHARPMATGRAPLEGALWFMTDSRSGKIEEIEQEPNVLLTYSDEAAGRYVSIAGTASITRERSRIHALWSEPARTWFPAGPDDPNIALIRVEIDEAEYWDGPTASMIALIGRAAAAVSADGPPEAGDNRRVDF